MVMGGNEPTLASGYLTLERLPSNVDYVSCTNTDVIRTSLVGYSDCHGTLASAVDAQRGLFVAPEDGHYEISFSGHLMSKGGRRVWATLYKLRADEEDKNDPGVSGASFLGMFAEDVRSGGRITSADISATTSLVSVEKLSKGEKACIGLGRWDPDNAIRGSKDMKTVHFNVRKL